MKKSIFGKALAFLAAGAMIFTALGCDTGDDSYLPEIPTTYKVADNSFGGNANVTAVWDFTGISRTATDTTTNGVWGIPYDSLGTTAVIVDSNGGFKQADGSTAVGAKLVPKEGSTWIANTGVLQASNKTASIKDLSGVNGILTLTLNEQANIVIKGKGAGAATAARLIAIADADGKLLAYKDNLSSSSDVLFVVKGAPAGAYTIYNNGSAFYYIDCSKASTADELKQPAQISKLELYKGDEIAPADASIEAAIDTLTLKAYDVVSSESKTDVTLDAIWTSSDESVATVKAGTVTGVGAGTAVIRARIGRFYDERRVTVTPCTKAVVTILAADNLPTTAVYAHTKADTDATPVALTDEEKTAFAANEAVKKAFKSVILNDSWISATDAELAMEDFGYDKEMPLGIQPKATDATNAGGKYGLSWKDGKNGVCATDAGKGKLESAWKIATLSYKVTPAKALKLVSASAELANGKNANDTILKLVVGSNDAVEMKTSSGSKDKSTYSCATNISVSAETTVKIEVWTCRNGNSFSLQDVQLAFGE